jgi:hypothetical protein
MQTINYLIVDGDISGRGSCQSLDRCKNQHSIKRHTKSRIGSVSKELTKTESTNGGNKENKII